jgi:xanthine dehydrogenase accessory factor
MNSMDQQVLNQLAEWLEAGRQSWLCTIIKTFGSSPRPVGSLLACCEDGLYSGSLSGGCVEDDLRESIFSGKLAKDRPECIQYGVAVEDVMRLGLPCGGTLELVVEPIDPSQAERYRILANAISERRQMRRRVNLTSGRTDIEATDHFAPLNLKDNIMTHTYGPAFQLLLIGAVQVAYYLTEIARGLDYQVAICDPRPELVDSFLLKDVPIDMGMPDDWLRDRLVDRHTAIIALCHDPRIDDMALMEALYRDAFYIGAMGSARTSEQRRRRLRELDIPDEYLNRLHAPVGLDIGSKTPPEIAIAIMAELTQLRAAQRA